MATQTPNYGFDVPTLDGDDDQWGVDLNDNWTSIDTLLKATDDKADAAVTTSTEAKTAADEAKTIADDAMPKAGGTFTGPVVFDATATFDVNSAATITNPDGLLTLKRTSTTITVGYSVDAQNRHSFLDIAGIPRAVVEQGDDLDLNDDLSLVTKARGDERYVQKTGQASNVQAYGQFNGLDGSLIGGVGLTMVRNAAGSYTVTLTTPRDDNTYIILLSCSMNNDKYGSSLYIEVGSQTTAEFNLLSIDRVGAAFDPITIHVTVIQ